MVVDPDPLVPITPEQQDTLRRLWPNGERLVAAWRLALDVETCEELLLGQPVDRNRLDPKALAWALERRLVRLERPIDLVEVT
jgi:hypothetical protein